VKILDISVKVTWNNRDKMCKLQWTNHTKEKPHGKKKIS
jgi:hypothetical protein